ncbi:MAG: hypothetical protein PVH68_08395 [Armatimonadota bacterium]
MTWVDCVIVVACVLIAAVEARRGFLPAALDLAALIVVSVIVTTYGTSLAGVTGFSPGASVAFIYLFLAAAAITGAKFASDAINFDIGPFDSAIAGVLGVFAGIVVGYGLVHTLILLGGTDHPAVAGSLLAPEVHGFRSYHRAVRFLQGLGTY